MGLRSLETELLLARVLQEVASSEHRVELRRCALAQLRDFTPFAAFQQLDRYNLHRLDSFDLTRYCQTNGLKTNEAVSKAIIQQYDGNGDGKLYEDEFYQLILPSTDAYWRDEALSRVRPSYLSVAASTALKALLEAEIEYHETVERVKIDLVTRADFHAFSAFQTIDAANIGQLDRASLKWFLRKHSFDPTDSDIDAVFRRWDTDDDERLAFREFADALAPIQPVGARETVVDLPRPADTPPREKPKASSSEPSKPEDMTIDDLKTDMKSSANRESKAEGELQASLRSSKSPYWPPPPPPTVSPQERDAVLDLFQEQLANLKELEAIRQEVALCADFTIEDAFTLLDTKDTGNVEISDFLEALDGMGIKVFGDDGEMVVKRYENGGNLSIKGLRAMVEASTDSYRRLLSGHTSQRMRASERSAVLRPSSRGKFVDLLRVLLHIEHRNEVRRQELQQLSEFRPALVFSLIDSRNRGYIGPAEVILNAGKGVYGAIGSDCE